MHLLGVANVDSGGADQAHKSAGFLAWHRAFLVQFERALQATHPGVSLHYWKQEVPSVPAAGDPPDQIAVFSRHFMGVNGTDADGSVILSRDNDLWGWEITGQALIRANFDRSSPSDYINNFEKDLVQLAQYRDLANPASSNSFSFQLESNPHNDGHGWVGGWMTSCRTSPQDPIFWMFHCDIDRLWARWQFTQGRFDPTGSDPASYMPNDNYALGSTVPLGHHLLDTMWPWNQITGAVVPDDPFGGSPAAGAWLSLTRINDPWILAARPREAAPGRYDRLPGRQQGRHRLGFLLRRFRIRHGTRGCTTGGSRRG